MSTTLVCIAMLAFLVFGLGFAVSAARARTGTLQGCPADPASGLHKLIRAHGNTAEYAPLLGLLFYLVARFSPGTAGLTLTVLATLSRYMLVAGILVSPTLARPHPLRAAGALGTWICGLALAALLVEQTLFP